MTALCGGGTSSPRAGLSDFLAVTGGGTGLIQASARFAWVLQFINLGSQAYSWYLPTLCATDPPGYPTFTGGDLFALITTDPGPDGQVAIGKLRDLIQTLAWYNSCQCDVGAQPTLPAETTQPTLPTVIEPRPASAAACATYPWSQPQIYNNINATPYVAPGTWPLPRNATSLRYTYTVAVAGAGPHAPQVYIQSRPSGWLSNGDGDPFVGSLGNGTFVRDMKVDGPLTEGPMSMGLELSARNGTTTSTDLVSGQVEVFCGGQVPGGVVSPCEADPVSTAMLQQILDTVTLIQRQKVPFAYVSGPIHSGLSGSGVITIGGVLGVLLNVSVPARAGLDVGTPDTVFDCGWINFGDDNGYGERIFIQSDSQLVFTDLAGVYELLGYTLYPGVTMTVTELLREP